MKLSMLCIFATLWFAVSAVSAQTTPLRVGHFPNVTHAQALIGRYRDTDTKAWFEQKLGMPIEWSVFNAGPSAMEALLAGSIDVAYVGPNPALNLFIKSKGRALRVIAGAAHGGSGLVVQPGKGFINAESLRGTRVATPQFGNTQDIAARAWFGSHGLTVTHTGGDVLVVPTEGPDQLLLFQRGELDAVWAVEPWLSRLILEAKGELLVDEKNALTTVLVASQKALTDRRKDVSAFVQAHRELSSWMSAHPQEATQRLQKSLSQVVGKELPPELIASSWGRLQFGATVQSSEFEEFVTRAKQVGFLKDAGDISSIVEEVQ